MNIPDEDYTSWDEEVLKIYLITSEDSLEENMEFTWNITDFSDTNLKIQVTFENPIYVSASTEKDKLQIVFMDSLKFISYKNLPIEKRYATNTKTVPKQIDKGKQFKLIQFSLGRVIGCNGERHVNWEYSCCCRKRRSQLRIVRFL